ncbi:thioredoxin-disulfide reductase [candidate division WOR-1 bacterium RIFOXYB2_FULL_42_35]|uniref:Thioredoxin reductase n=1 Tax=candidate division WOR-1 bacterium RIFOXYC2_FULL_41_25 TaxID=1802586 RepID=A0A1F4TQ15_UNCSA|nr:MAG: thioredoxin-disulfide reductase [candidate division WOR-1 bacterium RIFOXYB2_FULL_42_35]OGC24575.1 MAG: thioredoxin-disulfide reductase [candidate division WOR-1 bacterium RIFOXYA2_FULL_41_14]OGC34620.1 MAG: thioredoxin-disulfide reductase [candidate division WOR-1 bacterium RIFOXYC2_FULL_41_25]
MSTQLKTQPKVQKITKDKNPLFDLIILGGGPAGLTAALYALRAKLNVVLIEKMILGGTVTSTFQIENYPGFPEGLSGMELSNLMQEQVKKLNLEIKWGNASSIKKVGNQFDVQVDGKAISAKAVIIATGTEASKMGIPGEDKFRGRGVSYCATCDGPFYKDKNIAVLGGGNSAIEEALFLTRYAKKVFIIHRRDELRADKILADRAMANHKIYFLWHSTLKEIKGKEKVGEIVLKDLQSEKLSKLQIDGVFVYIGSKPNSDLVKETVKLDKKNYIVTDESMQTSVPGIFAAGDIRVKHLRQIVTAAADGAIAAEAAREYIEKLQ